MFRDTIPFPPNVTCEKNDKLTFTVFQVGTSLNISSKQLKTSKFQGHEIGQDKLV